MKEELCLGAHSGAAEGVLLQVIHSNSLSCKTGKFPGHIMVKNFQRTSFPNKISVELRLLKFSSANIKPSIA